MAYVGTPSMQGDPAYTLASIIQGEAGGQGQEGMRAVASVMQNRARTNFSGYGTDVLQQALHPNQFQGQATPSAASLAIARQLLAGAVQDNTGGATSYANPGASTAAWAKRLNETNAVKIGDHYFTDNQKGAPFLGSPACAARSARPAHRRVSRPARPPLTAPRAWKPTSRPPTSRRPISCAPG
jgi:N-acetylmuramoyl-L-alanine amidase